MSNPTHNGVNILEGCVLDMLPTLDEGCVHCCATSPPYFGLRDYGLEPSDWPAVSYAPMAGLPSVEVEAWTGQLGLEPTPEMYVGHLVHVFRLVRRVLRDDGTLWCNLGDSFCGGGGFSPNSPSTLAGSKQTTVGGDCKTTRQIKPGNGLKPKDLIGIPWRVALALQADGWWLRSEIIWAKGVSFCDTYAGSVMPESVTDRPTRAHEQVFLLTKKAKYYYDHEAVKEKSRPEQVEHNRRYAKEYEAHTESSKNGQPGNVNNVGIHARATGSKRNLRSVWVINPEPQKHSKGTNHYASWPSTLVAPMIKAGTSEKGVCPACLSPYERVVDYKANYERREPAHAPNSTPTKVDSTGWRPPDIKTTGWRATCDCEAGEPIPATVLDIFAGTGTTGEVARRLGRHAILIDRSGDYVQMSHERLSQGNLFIIFRTEKK